uniref:Uncharacterized protein n=1 Tax=Physcomitrium patens TaxID=3218 RepID=A0A2K1K687_PHYPA|nr:hypothetical protein PHYPA_011189 [Physcomitrium patens]
MPPSSSSAPLRPQSPLHDTTEQPHANSGSGNVLITSTTPGADPPPRPQYLYSAGAAAGPPVSISSSTGFRVGSSRTAAMRCSSCSLCAGFVRFDSMPDIAGSCNPRVSVLQSPIRYHSSHSRTDTPPKVSEDYHHALDIPLQDHSQNVPPGPVPLAYLPCPSPSSTTTFHLRHHSNRTHPYTLPTPFPAPPTTPPNERYRTCIRALPSRSAMRQRYEQPCSGNPHVPRQATLASSPPLDASSRIIRHSMSIVVVNPLAPDFSSTVHPTHHPTTSTSPAIPYMTPGLCDHNGGRPSLDTTATAVNPTTNTRQQVTGTHEQRNLARPSHDLRSSQTTTRSPSTGGIARRFHSPFPLHKPTSPRFAHNRCAAQRAFAAPSTDHNSSHPVKIARADSLTNPPHDASSANTARDNPDAHRKTSLSHRLCLLRPIKHTTSARRPRPRTAARLWSLDAVAPYDHQSPRRARKWLDGLISSSVFELVIFRNYRWMSASGWMLAGLNV